MVLAVVVVVVNNNKAINMTVSRTCVSYIDFILLLSRVDCV